MSVVNRSMWRTVAEVAAMASRSPRTVRQRCEDGTLAGAQHIGGIWLIPKTTAAAYAITTAASPRQYRRRATPPSPRKDTE